MVERSSNMTERRSPHCLLLQMYSHDLHAWVKQYSVQIQALSTSAVCLQCLMWRMRGHIIRRTSSHSCSDDITMQMHQLGAGLCPLTGFGYRFIEIGLHLCLPLTATNKRVNLNTFDSRDPLEQLIVQLPTTIYTILHVRVMVSFQSWFLGRSHPWAQMFVLDDEMRKES